MNTFGDYPYFRIQGCEAPYLNRKDRKGAKKPFFGSLCVLCGKMWNT